MDPLCRGVYAADCKSMSLKSCFSNLYEMEKNHRSIIRGTIKSARSRKGKIPYLLAVLSFHFYNPLPFIIYHSFFITLYHSFFITLYHSFFIIHSLYPFTIHSLLVTLVQNCYLVAFIRVLRGFFMELI